MKKAMYKKILCIINNINLETKHDNLFDAILLELQKETIEIQKDEVQEVLTYINSLGIVYKDKVGYDLIPCGCVFARANNGSISEALAFLECLWKQRSIYEFFKDYVLNKKNIQWTSILDSTSFHILTQTVLWDKQNQGLNQLLLPDITYMIHEYEDASIIISETLSAIYANELIDYNDPSLKYRNFDNPIVEYKNKSMILEIIPKRGIPENRDITKPTQSFYKDTLLHEFHHTCPICGIDLPHMLIASHIKPFRDCAHIFETLDYHNGLLLCRNHDYLFDQGYISFDDNGTILICEEMIQQEHLLNAFHIHKQTTLSQEYINDNRKLFLEYHRHHIYKS